MRVHALQNIYKTLYVAVKSIAYMQLKVVITIGDPKLCQSFSVIVVLKFFLQMIS